MLIFSVHLYGLDFAQPSWTTTPMPFEPTQANKIQWRISEEDVTNPESGILYIDDVVVNGWIWVPPTVCQTVGAPGTPPAPGALLSDMETTPVNRNAYGYYWYAFNDAANRVPAPAPGEYSQITAGATPNSVNPLQVTIDIDGNGHAGSNGAYIKYLLGKPYKIPAPATDPTGADSFTVKPFVGVGTMLSNPSGSGAYNAKADGHSQLYFDYMTDLATGQYLTVEVAHNPAYVNPGIVHHCLAQATGGAWKSITVDLAYNDSCPGPGLCLPEWEEVNLMSDAERQLNTDAATKIQWAVHGDPGDTGSFAVDNVYLGPGAVISPSDINIEPKLKVQLLDISARKNIISINYPFSSLEKGNAEILTISGEIIDQKSIQQSANSQIEFNVREFAEELTRGIYFIRLNAIKKTDGSKVAITKPFSYLK